MKRPTFAEGVAVALVAALLGSIAYTVLPTIAGPGGTLRLTIVGLALGYVLYLLRRSDERTGRVVTLAAWCLIAALGWVLIDSPLLFLGLHLGLAWLVRALYHQPGTLAAVLDLGLHLLALAAGAWAFVHAGNVFLGIWTFFLVQALFVVVPAADGRRRDDNAAGSDRPDPFQAAYRNAEAALRKLSTHP